MKRNKLRKYQGGGKIKIRDTRTIDTITGKPVADNRRMHANIDESFLENIISSANKYGVDPYTALAIGLQETGFRDEHKANPFKINPSHVDMDTYEEMISNPASGSIRYMKDKFEYARKLGKSSEEDIIQAWNGYGTIGGKGKGLSKMYGIDVSEEPIDMKMNPVYGKRIVNLRDSVLKTNPEIQNIVDEVSEYKSGGKMKSKIYIKPSKRGTFTAAAKKHGKSVQGFASQVLRNKGNYSPAMIKKANFARNASKWKHEDGGLLMPEDIFENYNYNPEYDLNDMYSFGGWLKKNIGNIAKTALGAGLSATGIGAGLGASLMASGVSGAVGSIGQGDEEGEIAEVYKPAVSNARQIYDTTVAENGMNLKDLSKRTDYIGEDHDEGGINFQFQGSPVEVEGGESRTGDIIHSDKIKIGPAMIMRYGGRVPISKKDIGRSISDVVKRNDRRFEKRSGDTWNDTARKVSQVPFEEMSDELSQINNIAEEMKKGGRLSGWKAGKMLRENQANGQPLTDRQKKYFGMLYGRYKQGRKAEGGLRLNSMDNPFMLPEATVTANKNVYPQTDWDMIDRWLNVPSRVSWIPEPKVSENNKLGTAVSDTKYITYPAENDLDYYWNLMEAQNNANAYNPDKWISNDLEQIKAGNTIAKAPTSQLSAYNPAGNVSTPIEPEQTEKTAFDGGLAPIVASGAGLVSNLLRKPEKVRYPQVPFTPTEVSPISSEAGIQRIKRTTGDTRERLRRLNPRGYFNNLRNIQAQEQEAIGDYTAQLQGANAETYNRARMMDAQNRSRLGMFNSEVAMKEAEANAMNRAARRNAIDAYLMNIGTQIGQRARDNKLYEMQERYQDQMAGVLGELKSIWGGNKFGGRLAGKASSLLKPRRKY